jgi:hypothetical protein
MVTSDLAIGQTAQAIADAWKHAHRETKLRLNRQASIVIAKMFEVAAAGCNSPDGKERAESEAMAEALVAFWRMARPAACDA